MFLGTRSRGTDRFVLICGDEVLGRFPTESAAVRAGFERCGLIPFFVAPVRRRAEQLCGPHAVPRP
jgi:hypothetical protein